MCVLSCSAPNLCGDCTLGRLRYLVWQDPLRPLSDASRTTLKHQVPGLTRTRTHAQAPGTEAGTEAHARTHF